MPRKKVRTVTVVEEPEILDDPFERAQAEFSAGDVGELKLRVDRYEDGDQREKYLRQVNYNPEVHGNDWIRKTWGPGSYLLRFYDRKTRRGWSKVVDIAADGPASPAPPTGVTEGGATVASVLQEQNKLLMQALLAGRAPAGAGTADGVLLKLLEGDNELKKTLLSSMLNRGDTTATLLSTVEQITKVAAELHTESDGGWLSQVRAIAKEFMPVISQMVRAPRPGIPPPALAAGAPPNPPVTASERAAGSHPDMMHFLDEVLRQYAPALLTAAQQGASAEDVADDILGEVPPKYYPMFDSLASDRILALEPRLSPYQAFVAEVVRLLKQRDFEGEAEAE